MKALKILELLILLIISEYVGRADALDNWTWRNPIPPAVDLSDVTYGNGQFIAVGESGTILTSTDAANWTIRRSLKRDFLTAVSYANDRFVALGYNGENSIALTSADGVDWVERPALAQDYLPKAVFGNGQFVAVGSNRNVLTSRDGTNWTTHPSGAKYDIVSVAYGNGRFVVSAQTELLSSEDGVTWTHRIATPPNISGVTFGKGRFVAVGGGGTILSSVDGATWTQLQPGTGGFNAITYGAGQFVVVGDYGTILTSVDRTNWISCVTGTQYHLNAVAYGNARFVAGGGYGSIPGGGVILTSTDGMKWEQNSPEDWQVSEIAFDNDQFIARGYDGKFGDNVIATSRDGTNWSRHKLSTDNIISGMAYGEAQIIVVGGNSLWSDVSEATILTSTDGANWVERPPATTNQLYSVAYGNGQFVAVGGHVEDILASGRLDRGSIISSTDGVNWGLRVSDALGLRKIAYGGGQFAALGDEGVLLTSADGSSWTRREAGSIWPGGIAFGNGHFVVIGGNRTIVESGSIINLSLTRASSPGSLIFSIDGPTGVDYTIQSSTDLITWRDLTKINNAQSSQVILDGSSVTAGRQFYRATSE